jgi:hypothetical protein
MAREQGNPRQDERKNRQNINDDHPDAPWRNTPLDNWSRDVDPSIMSGDKWVDNDHDLGTTRRENIEIMNGKASPVMAPFMHPTHDVSMRNGDEDI